MKWRRRCNGAYWIDGVEEAHRQMVPDQGNLTRNIIVIQKMIKSLSALYFQQIVSCGRAKIIRDVKEWSQCKAKAKLPYRNEKAQKYRLRSCPISTYISN